MNEDETEERRIVFQDDYQIIEQLGEGAFGTVYLAHQIGMERKVALKVLKSDVESDESVKNRFLQEVRIISQLRHPNTVTIHDFGETDDDKIYMVLEFLEGQTLSDLQVEQSQLSPPLAVKLVKQVASALAEAHEAGVTHRDLKPENIIVTEINGKAFAKVLDFGIAQLADTADINLTAVEGTQQQASFVGTPSYMSPEQVEGNGVGPRSDIYSLGLVLYELLTGAAAVEADSAINSMSAHLSDSPLDLPKLSEVPESLQQTIRKMTAKNPDERYQTTDKLQRRLTELEDEYAGDVAEDRDTTDIETTEVLSYSNKKFVTSDQLHKMAGRGESEFEGTGHGLKLDPKTGELVTEPIEKQRELDKGGSESGTGRKSANENVNPFLESRRSETGNGVVDSLSLEKDAAASSQREREASKVKSDQSDRADESSETSNLDIFTRIGAVVFWPVSLYFGAFLLPDSHSAIRLLPGLSCLLIAVGFHYLFKWLGTDKYPTFSSLVFGLSLITWIGVHAHASTWQTAQMQMLENPIWFSEYLPAAVVENEALMKWIRQGAKDYVFLIGKLRSLI